MLQEIQAVCKYLTGGKVIDLTTIPSQVTNENTMIEASISKSKDLLIRVTSAADAKIDFDKIKKQKEFLCQTALKGLGFTPNNIRMISFKEEAQIYGNA